MRKNNKTTYTVRPRKNRQGKKKTLSINFFLLCSVYLMSLYHSRRHARVDEERNMRRKRKRKKKKKKSKKKRDLIFMMREEKR